MWMKKQTGCSPEGRQDTREHRAGWPADVKGVQANPLALLHTWPPLTEEQPRKDLRHYTRPPALTSTSTQGREAAGASSHSPVLQGLHGNWGPQRPGSRRWRPLKYEPQDDLHLCCTPAPTSSATNAHCWRQMKPGSGGGQYQWKAITSGKSIERRVPSNSTLEQKTYPLPFIQSGLHFLSGFWTLLSAFEMISPR